MYETDKYTYAKFPSQRVSAKRAPMGTTVRMYTSVLIAGGCATRPVFTMAYAATEQNTMCEAVRVRG